MSADPWAQKLNTGGQDLLHGSIFTAQGQPAVEVAVELRGLRGIKVASAVTDRTGNFQMYMGAAPGENVSLVTRGYQVKYEQVLLAQPGLEFEFSFAPCQCQSCAGREVGLRSPGGSVVDLRSFQRLKKDSPGEPCINRFILLHMGDTYE